MENREEYKILNINSTQYKTKLSRKFENRTPFKPADPFMVKSFIPGTVVDILVKEGQELKHGDVVIILDAMKMQNRLKTHVDGCVKKINVKRGDKVTKGAVLLEMEKDISSASGESEGA